MSRLNRRGFMKVSAASLGAAAAACSQPTVEKKSPNILVIITDQMSSKMLSCAGNKHVKTPNLDRLAASGVRFERAYCTAPVCIPSRFSLITGRMPSEISLRSNDLKPSGDIPQIVFEQGIGSAFKNADYDAAYGGKEHLPKMRVKDLGYDYICKDERDVLAETCADFIKQERDKPFLLVSSLINPHDICYMAIRDFAESDFSKHLIKTGVIEVATLDKALFVPENIGSDEFFEKHCPPLPDNFEAQQDEPEAVHSLLAQRPFRLKARERWPEKQWRMHRWAYHRLTEFVDAQIGVILDALEESGKVEDTVVIFTSDHGDMDSSHRMEHKTVFYDEASRIPLIVSQPGTTVAGKVEDTNLVSNGLDLYPTLCDYAGIAVPEDLRGQSFRPLAEGRPDYTPRKYIPVENEIGYMVVTDKFKYAMHDSGKNREQLYDLANDPDEMRNALNDAGNEDVIRKHRALFREEFGNM